MAETNGKLICGVSGRLLDYEVAVADEKIVAFKKRVEEQIAVLRIGIVNGDVNDPQISESYAKKAERFLSIPYFTDKKNKDKRVRNLKTYTKIIVAFYKAVSDIVEEWVARKRGLKVIFANNFSPFSEKKANFDYVSQRRIFYDEDLEFLYGVRPKYESEHILMKRLLGLLADTEFLKAIGGKNSWKVSTLKEALSEWILDQSLEADRELEEVFKLPYFRHKRFLNMEVREFKEIVSVRVESLKKILEWIDTEIASIAKAKREIKDSLEMYGEKGIYDIFGDYDLFISQYTVKKKSYSELYSLYRFGQGLMEADIFASLYK